MESILTERMNLQSGEVANAHIMTNVNLGFSTYDTLCLICAELDINLDTVSDSDFESAAICLEDFAQSLNEESGYTMSVWFD